MTEQEVIDFFAAEHRRQLTLLAKSGVKISEKAIKEEEKEFAEKYDVDETSLGFLSIYETNYVDAD